MIEIFNVLKAYVCILFKIQPTETYWIILMILFNKHYVGNEYYVIMHSFMQFYKENKNKQDTLRSNYYHLSHFTEEMEFQGI